MAGACKKFQPSLAGANVACDIVIPQPERGDGIMADDAVMEILMRIQSSIVALDEKTQASLADLDKKFTTQLTDLDKKFTTQNTILAQDVRLIRAGIQDIVRTRVTAGEVDVLHEDMSKLQLGLTALAIRVEALEHSRS